MRLRLTQKEIAVINRAFANITQVDFSDLTEEHHDFCNEVAEPLRQKILDQFDLTPEKEPKIRIEWWPAVDGVSTKWVYEQENQASLLGSIFFPKDLWQHFSEIFGGDDPIYLERKGIAQAEIYTGLGKTKE